MGVKVRELMDEDIGYILSGLVELKKVYNENEAYDETMYVDSLIDDLKSNKVYIGEHI